MRTLLVLVLMAVTLGTACSSGGPTVRREPPGVQLESLRLDGDRARLGLLLHNRNDHRIQVRALRLAMMLGDETLIEDRWSVVLDIGPRVRERVPLETMARPGALDRLARLDAGDDASIGYRLLSEVELIDQSRTEQRREGFLHPVPGQPGRYR